MENFSENINKAVAQYSKLDSSLVTDLISKIEKIKLKDKEGNDFVVTPNNISYNLDASYGFYITLNLNIFPKPVKDK